MEQLKNLFLKTSLPMHPIFSVCLLVLSDPIQRFSTDKIFLLVIGSFTCMQGVNSVLKVSLSLFQGTPNILSLVLEAGESLPWLLLTISLLINSRDVTLLCHL